MIVCHCQAVNDRTIRRSVREGAATSAEVARHCRAGGRCGGCRPAIEQIIETELMRSPIAARTTAESLADRR